PALVIGRPRAALVASRRRPSPLRRWVGFRVNCFGAFSAFTLVTACPLAGLLYQPFPSRASAVWLPARLSRLLPGAMTISRAGLSPAGLRHPFHGARRSQLIPGASPVRPPTPAGSPAAVAVLPLVPLVVAAGHLPRA